MVNKRNKSQIATIIVLIIAVIFLFTLMSINLSRVSQKKTAVDNVADSVGLQLASQLGSISTALKQEFEIYKNEIKDCDANWQLMLGVFMVVAGIAGFIFTAGQSGWLAAMGVMMAQGAILGGALLSAQGATIQFVNTNPQAVESMRIKMKILSSLQQVIEMPVQAGLFALNDDPAWVRDDFDMDRDSDTQDLIPRFVKWYNLRLNSFQSISMGEFVRDFIRAEGGRNSFFLTPDGLPRFAFKTNENLMVMSEEDFKKQGMGKEAAKEAAKDAVRWQVRVDGSSVKLVPWFRDELKGMLQEMRRYGYGINVNVIYDEKGNISEIKEINDKGRRNYEDVIKDTWVEELEQFENIMVRGLYNMDFDSTVGGLDIWWPMFRNNDPKAKDKDWYTRLENLKRQAIELRDTLILRRDSIDDCVSRCRPASDYCCSSKGDQEACDWVCVSCC